MIPSQCMVKHDPPNSYGDCLRACVASLLELGTCDVPHFLHDGCSGAVAQQRMTDWLLERKLQPFFIHLDGSSMTLAELLHHMETSNPNAHYMLFGSTRDGGHVVIARGGEIVHNPAWDGARIVGPQPDGFWSICVLTQA